MRKGIVASVVLVLLAFLPAMASAHGPVYVNAADGEAPASIHDAEAGMSPEHPLYFLDTFGERMSLTFTFNKEKRAEKALDIAEEKMAELDHLKEHVVFNEGATTKHLETAFERYEEHMQNAEDALGEFDQGSEELPEMAERIAEKRAEHRAAFEEHREVLPEQIHARVDEQIKRAEEHQERVLERVHNPVVRAQIEERIVEHTRDYVERREEWLDFHDEARLRIEEAKFRDEVRTPEELETAKEEIEERFEEIKEKRRAHFEAMQREVEEDRVRIEEERREDERRLDEAGFDSEEEAIEAYEALDEEGRAKMRDFFGVDKADADATIREVRELREEHGDEWKQRLEERHRMDREEDFEHLRRDLDLEEEELEMMDERLRDELLRAERDGFDPRERFDEEFGIPEPFRLEGDDRSDGVRMEDHNSVRPVEFVPDYSPRVELSPAERSQKVREYGERTRIDFRQPEMRAEDTERERREDLDFDGRVPMDELDREREMRDVYLRDDLDLRPGEVLSQPLPRDDGSHSDLIEPFELPEHEPEFQ